MSLHPKQMSGFLSHTYILIRDNIYISSDTSKLRVTEKKLSILIQFILIYSS